VKVSN